MRLIDADKLKEFIHRDNILSRASGFDNNKRHIREMLTYIDIQPTVEAEPIRHGHWETIYNAYGEIEGWICECGREVKSKSNYCPACGAKMEEDNE